MRYTRHITFILLLASLLVGCSKDDRTPAATDVRILFSADILDLDVSTRASVVSSSTLDASGIYVSATSGSAGSETSLWASTSFTKVGSYFDGGRYWDESNPGYHFYSANAPLTFSAAGTTVSASNTTDVVCEYLASPTFKGVNTLDFDHIFARIGNVTVSAADGYTITNVHMSITPYTGGTYNLRTGSGQSDGTGWSALTSGSATELANTTPSTKSNDLYLVPGTYDISVTWTATKGAYTIDAEKTFSGVAVEGGKVNAITVSLKGDASSVELGVTVTPWTGNAVAMGEVMAIEEGTFGGLYIAQGNMYYDGSQFRIADDWTYHSNDVSRGLNVGSSFFEWDECHDATVDDWRLPTRSEWQTILTTSSAVRPGSTVNGVANKHWAVIELPDYYYTDGLLVFPDGKSLYGYNLGVMDDPSDLTPIDVSILNEYLQQGCIFLPAFGYWEDVMDWVTDFNQSYYYSSTEKGEYNAYGIAVGDNCFGETNLDKYSYFLTRLVKEVPKVYSFGGLEIAPGNLYWDGSEWSIDETWDEHCTNGTGYGVFSGLASSYFNFLEIGDLFEKEGFTTTDGNIDNLLDPLNGWRLPTSSEWNTIYTTSSAVRVGSTVNGQSNKHFAYIRLTGITYANNAIPKGLLVFPDGEIITGTAFTYFDGTGNNTGVTVSTLNTYLEQGCVFIPCSGNYYHPGEKWNNAGTAGLYWSSTEYSVDNAYYAFFPTVTLNNTAKINTNSYPVRLVRPIE